MPDKMPLIVTAAVILDGAKRLFLARRKANDALGGYWEFPGGKLEAGEKPDECLQREILEELDMNVRAYAPLNFSYFEYSNKKILLLAYLCEHIGGEPRAVDCDDFGFFTRAELERGGMKIAPADIPLLNEILERGIVI